MKRKDCEGCYIGQTSQNLETTCKQHMRHVKNKQLNKSALTPRFWSHKHKFEEEPKLLKNIIDHNRNYYFGEKKIIKIKKFQLILIYLSSMTFLY